MNKKQIKSFIDSYEPMMTFIGETIKKLQLVDFEAYRTGRGIERADIDTWNGKTTVDIVYDDSTMGCYDQGSTSFPAEWLLLSDEELIKVATEERDERRRVEKEKADVKVAKEKADKEAKEREQYEKLKAKFEIPIITNDDEGPFDAIDEANYQAEIFYPDDVIVSTKTGLILCETFRCRAWQPNGEYSYSFHPKNK